MRSISLRTIAIATVAVLAAGFALAFFYAPEDADQGFIQKIFYLHVPLAICALLGFVVAAIHAIRHLRTGDPIHDARSYVSIHLSVIFGVGVLLTGAIWARGSWGVWWEWREPTLVSFLIVFLLYATYYPLRYAIEDRDRQARYASVFAITAGAFVPLNFLAVRLAEPLIHPRTFSSAGGLPADMMLAFLVCLAGMALLWVTLVRFELGAKAASGGPRQDSPRPPRRRGAPGARPLDRPGRRLGDQRDERRARRPTPRGGELMPPLLLAIEDAEGYVGGAYLVFLLLLLVYVAIMAAKLQRIQRDLSELAELAEQPRRSEEVGRR